MSPEPSDRCDKLRHAGVRAAWAHWKRRRAFVVRFETAPGEQAQVDFAPVSRPLPSEPDTVRIVWLFSMVLGYSRLIWARFALRQTMRMVLACHKAAFEAIGGMPRKILYDSMKTAVSGGG
jgi:transposase